MLLYHKGSWGAICDDMWNDAAADVACRQRGFPGSARAPLKMEFGGRGKREYSERQRRVSCLWVGAFANLKSKSKVRVSKTEGEFGSMFLSS